jgi:endo-1,3-1,4-beta-glycanase ExoK
VYRDGGPDAYRVNLAGGLADKLKFRAKQADNLFVDKASLLIGEEGLKTLRTLVKVLTVAALGGVLALSGPSPAHAQGASFRDDFDDFDSSRWIKSDHVLGLTDFDPANAVVADGQLRLNVPASTTGGAELESVDSYGYGSYRARIKAADAPSSITGFYLYRSPDYQAEIDIEIYNDGRGDVDFVTFADGRRTHHTTRAFRFDPSKRFHTYRFDYEPGRVSFYVDGKRKQVWKQDLPQGPMKLLVNTWFPAWLPGLPADEATATHIDWISYRQS